jgi:hypothetical protein
MENYQLKELYASKWYPFSQKLEGIVKDEQFVPVLLENNFR